MIKLELLLSPPSVNTIWINKPGGRFKSEKGRKFEKESQIFSRWGKEDFFVVDRQVVASV